MTDWALTKSKGKRHESITHSLFQFYHDQYRKVLDPLQWLGLFFVVGILWDKADHQRLLGWMCLVIFGYILFSFYNHLYLKRELKAGRISRQARYLFVGLCAMGAASWAICGYLVLDLTNTSTAAYAVVTSCLLIAAPALSLSYFPAYAAWNICHATLTVYLYISLGYYGFAGFIFLMSFTYLYFSRRSVAIQYENLHLVERLSEEKLKAENASADKSRFLASASHDLRQPLHSISLFTSVLTKGFVNEQQIRVGKKLEQSVEALTNLFDAILDISKLDAGVVEATISSVSLNEIFKTLETGFSPQAELKGIELDVRDCDYYVFTDKLLLERILRNIVSNSVYYTQSGLVRVEATLGSGSQVCISVIDTGVGIPNDKIEEVFEEFSQLDNRGRDRRKGLGLGLSIVKRLAEVLELHFKIQSTEGKGTAFHIYLPKSGQLPSLAAAPVIQKDPLVANGQLIYVVEDEPDIREGYLELLSGWGYTVNMYSSITELEADGERPAEDPVAIIADYRLENGLTGVDAIQIIRRRHHYEVPAVIVTGDKDPERLRMMSPTGFTVLQKPVAPGKLRSYLANMARSKAG